MLRLRLSTGWLLIGLLMTLTLVTGCFPAVPAGGGAGQAAASTPDATGVAPPSTTAAPATVHLGDMAVTFTARVAEVAASARFITFAAAVEGYNSAALTDTSQIVSTDAAPLGLQDVKPGMSVQVTGRPGGSNAVLAEQIVVLGVGAAPSAATTGEPAIMLNPAGGGTGTQVTVDGIGFPVNARVEIRLAQAGEAGGQPAYAEATVDGKGGFIATFTLPGEWPAGQTISEPQLMVVATTSDGSARATAEFAYHPSGPQGSATPAAAAGVGSKGPTQPSAGSGTPVAGETTATTTSAVAMTMNSEKLRWQGVIF